MTSLHDPTVSAACLALREAPPSALDDPILQYAREAIAANYADRVARQRWQKRMVAMGIALGIVVVAFSAWDRPWDAMMGAGEVPVARVTEAPPVAEPVAAIPTEPARVEPLKTPARAARDEPRPVAKKAVGEPKRTTAPARTPPPAPVAIPDEPVQVTPMSAVGAEDPLPTEIAPPATAPVIDAGDTAVDCEQTPLDPACGPP